MGMEGNKGRREWAIKSPSITVLFDQGPGYAVDIPADAIRLNATRDQAFALDRTYGRSINILIPGHLPKRGRDPSIIILFDPDGTFREIVGNRMPALSHDRSFAPAAWARAIDYGQTYEILSGYDGNPRKGWPTQEMPPAKVLLVPMYKSQSDDKGTIGAVRGFARTGLGHPFFRPTLNLLPIGGLEVGYGIGLNLAYHPVNNQSLALLDLGIAMAFNKWDNEFDYVVGIRSGAGGVARPGRRNSVVGYEDSKGQRGWAGYALAHELGHNMSLKHAPCGTEIGGLDDDYPWPDGSIGPTAIRGIDFGPEALRFRRVREWGGETIRSIRRPMLLDPNGPMLLEPNKLDFTVDGRIPDLMSYCDRNYHPQKWISAYHFNKALNYRQPATSNRVRTASVAGVNALVLAGGRTPDGELFIRPAFVGEVRPELPQGGGPYRIGGHDARSRELFSLDFDMTEVADGDGAAMFLFAVPVGQEWESALARVTLTGPEGSASLDRDGGAAAVLLRDSTGEVRGILSDLENNVLTPGEIAAELGVRSLEGWDVQISHGIPDALYWRK